MVKTLKLTSKRQATFPVALCNELGVSAGDELKLERRVLDGEAAWVLQVREKPETSWFGSLNAYAPGKTHDMEIIRAATGKLIGKAKA